MPAGSTHDATLHNSKRVKKMARNEVRVAGRELSAVDEDLPLFVLLTILSSYIL